MRSKALYHFWIIIINHILPGGGGGDCCKGDVAFYESQNIGLSRFKRNSSKQTEVPKQRKKKQNGKTSFLLRIFLMPRSKLKTNWYFFSCRKMSEAFVRGQILDRVKIYIYFVKLWVINDTSLRIMCVYEESSFSGQLWKKWVSKL